MVVGALVVFVVVGTGVVVTCAVVAVDVVAAVEVVVCEVCFVVCVDVVGGITVVVVARVVTECVVVGLLVVNVVVGLLDVTVVARAVNVVARLGNVVALVVAFLCLTAVVTASGVTVPTVTVDNTGVVAVLVVGKAYSNSKSGLYNNMKSLMVCDVGFLKVLFSLLAINVSAVKFFFSLSL